MVDVVQLYNKINALCVMRVLESVEMVDSSELLFFQNECRRFLEIYNQHKQMPTEEELFCNDVWQEDKRTLSEAIKGAYHSVLFKDTLANDERYFLEREPCGLLKWSETESPYRDLHAVSAEVSEKQDIRMRDVEHVFERVYKLLETHAGDALLFKKLCEELKDMQTKSLKYSEQSLEQR